MVQPLHRPLLEQAEHLARREPRRPRQASLRRSVSCSYYALFHAIAWEYARVFRADVRGAAARMLQHGVAKNAANAIRGNEVLVTLPGSPECPAPLLAVADDFIRLQDAREDADYSLSTVFERRAVLEMLERSRRSIAALELARGVCPTELQAFVLALLGSKRI